MEKFDTANQLPAERRRQLLAYLQKYKAVQVRTYAAANFINEATLRRDLAALERAGLVKRSYGGAILAEGPDNEIPLFVREPEHREQKEWIAAKAALKVRDGDTLILDSSSTTLRMIPHLAGKKDLKIITNGAKTAVLLSKLPCRVYCTGGLLRENSLSFIGTAAVEFLRRFRADAAFFSCRALSPQGEFSDNIEEEADLRRAMIERSGRSYLLLDSSKLGAPSLFTIGTVADIDGVISDGFPPPAHA